MAKKKTTSAKEPTLVITRIFDAPRELVFDAYTKPELLTRWMGVMPGWTFAVCEIDLRPNGAFRWVHRGAGGGAYSFTGTYREITPPERLVFATRMFPSSPESVGTLVFAEERGKTKFTMTIECHSIEDRDALLRMRVDAGTARTLENLAEYLHKIA